MKKQLIFIFMVAACLLVFGQNARAIDITVDPFGIRFNDAFPQSGCSYTIEWRLVVSDGSYASNWIYGQQVVSPGSYSLSGSTILGVPELTPPVNYLIQVKVTKICTGEIRYGYSSSLELDDKYHLLTPPDGLTIVNPLD